MTTMYQVLKIKKATITTLIIFFLLSTLPSKLLSQDERMISLKCAERVYDQYLESLKKRDLKGAANHWNKKEIKLYKIYDFILAPPHNYNQEISARCIGYDHEIVDHTIDEKSVVIKYKYTLKEQLRDKWKAPLVFYENRYFIKENNEWLLANPIKVLTQEWNHHETNYVNFYYPKDITPYLSFCHYLDSMYYHFATLFKYEPQDKPFVYLCHSDQLEELSTVKGRSASGRTFPENNVVISIFEKRESTKELPEININTCLHELLHVLAYKIFAQDRRSVPFLREGLAVAYAGTGGIPAEVTFSWAKEAISQNKNPGLLALNDPNIFYSKINRHYSLAGSFIRFLIEKYGGEKFKTFYTQLNKPELFNDVLIENYKKSIEEIEIEWKEFVKMTPISFDEKWAQFTLDLVDK